MIKTIEWTDEGIKMIDQRRLPTLEEYPVFKTYREVADAIRTIGPESCVLSSDLGQQGNALPPDGFGAFLIALRDKGFTERELDRMSKENPARLLGVK